MPSKPGEPPAMGSFLKQQSPVREALPLPHIASLTYFRSPQKSQSASPIPRPIPPTPRKMSSIPVVNHKTSDYRRRRRQSAIPRPTSALARSPERLRFSTPTSNASSAALQKSSQAVQPRTYSRTQRSSVSSGDPAPTLSYEFSRDLLPRSDSLLPYNQQPVEDDLSGIRQQLHIRNYSTQSLASIDTAACPNKNRSSKCLPLPAPGRLPKSKTSASLAKPSLNLTPQRQLMKPIDPPLPRSHTMGSLSRFAGDGTKETPTSVKSDSRIANARSGAELSIRDVLDESRMTDDEVEVYKQVTTEVQMNKQRIEQVSSREIRHSTADARQIAESFSESPPQADPCPAGVAGRFGKIDVTKNEEMDRKLLRKDRDRRRDERSLPVDGTASGGLHVDTHLASMIQSPPTSVTPHEMVDKTVRRPPHNGVCKSAGESGAPFANSGIGVRSNPEDEWEVNVKLVKENPSPPSCTLSDPDFVRQVYFHQEMPYWTGRFSSICDRLRTADVHLVASSRCSAIASLNGQTIWDTEESFEMTERRRMKYALKELRSYCRTSAAIRSFEEFETQLRENLDKRAEAHMKVANDHAVQSKVQTVSILKPKADFRPKLGWHFGQSQMSDIAGKAISTGSATTSKHRPVMVKSKTTSNLASVSDGGIQIMAIRETASGKSDVKSLPGLSWQRPTIQEAQAHARRIREQRVFAKAATYRRASGQDSGVGRGRMGDLGATIDTKESVGTGVAQGGQGAGPHSADAKSAVKAGHSRKSSGADSLNLKKVLSESMKGMRKMKRSFTGSGSVSGNDKIDD